MTTTDIERDFEEINPKLRFGGRFDPRLLQNKNLEDGYPGIQKAFRNYLHLPRMELDLNLNSKNIDNVGNVDGVDISAISLSNQPSAPSGDIDANTQKIVNLDAPVANNDGARKTDVDTVQSNLTTHIGLTNPHISNLNQVTTRNHSDLQNVSTSQHHIKTTSSEISLASMAEKAHGSLTGVTSDQHHTQAHELNGADHLTTANLDWSKVNKTGSNLIDLATRQHAGLTNVTSDQHHAQSHALDSHTVPAGNIAMNTKKFTGLVNGSAAADSMAFGQKYTNANAVTAVKPYLGIGNDIEVLQWSNDAQITYGAVTPAKRKGIIAYRNIASCIIKWEMKATIITDNMSGSIYKNGSRVGSWQYTSSLDYVEFSQIVTNIYTGDTLDLWGGGSLANSKYMRYFRIYYEFFEDDDPV